MKVLFRKQNDGIYCEVLDIQSELFTNEDGFYCYNDEVFNDEFKVIYRIKIQDEVFQKEIKISSKKKHLYFRKRKNGFCIMFKVPKGKYAEEVSTKNRFYFFQEECEQLTYSIKIQEERENSFDYEILEEEQKEQYELGKKQVKKKRTSEEERKLKRQKWILEHPYQGGAFSPK